MLGFRQVSTIVLLWLIFSAQAYAYQYAGYAPYGYAQPVRAYAPYARPVNAPPYPAAWPYPRDYRYPPQPASMYRYSHPAEQPVSSTKAPGALTAPHADNQPSSVNAVTMMKQPSKPESISTHVDTSAAAKKQAFIQELLPQIEKENERLLKLRLQVVELFQQLQNDESGSARQLQTLAKQYRVKGDVLSSASARDQLLSKVDVIPSSLALAQAASESAWGQSRFATEANNLFGIWTYDESKGLKPKDREQGKTHLVRVFDDIGDSVRYYMHTLNSHPAYDELRAIRRQSRESGQEISGHELAAGLEKYSAKGQAYIDLIRSLIRQNKWARLDTGDQPA